MNKIEEIIYGNSTDTGNGMEIDYSKMRFVLDSLKEHQKKQITNCTLHMLNYCFENVGNQEVNVAQELEKWIKENEI